MKPTQLEQIRALLRHGPRSVDELHALLLQQGSGLTLPSLRARLSDWVRAGQLRRRVVHAAHHRRACVYGLPNTPDDPLDAVPPPPGPTGAVDQGGCTPQEVARALGISRQRVSQLERKALRKLRHGLLARGYTLDLLLPDRIR